jgi:hypothetical protein
MPSQWSSARIQRSAFRIIAGTVFVFNIVCLAIAQVPQAWSWSADHPEQSFQTRTSSTDRIFQALKKYDSYDMKQMKLNAVMQHLSDQFEIPILIDEKGLEEEALTVDEPISISLTNMPLGNALHWLLSPLNLTYSIESEVLLITSSRGASGCLVVYDVTRITTDQEDFPSRGNFLSPRTMIHLIETSIVPSDWLNQGGLSTIEWFRDKAGKRHLLVSAPFETHQRIEAFLSVLCQGSIPARLLRESYRSSRKLRILDTSGVRPSNMRRAVP